APDRGRTSTSTGWARAGSTSRPAPPPCAVPPVSPSTSWGTSRPSPTSVPAAPAPRSCPARGPGPSAPTTSRTRRKPPPSRPSSPPTTSVTRSRAGPTRWTGNRWTGSRGLPLRLLRQHLVQRFRGPAAELLDGPDVAVRVREVHERGAVGRGVLNRLGDVEAARGQFRVGGPDVGDAELKAPVGAGVRPGAARNGGPEAVAAEGDGAAGPRRGQLDDAHARHDLLVDVDVEADLVAVEVPGPVDVAHRERDHF